MSIILKTTNLCKSFNGQTAVNNISLNIERNAFTCVLRADAFCLFYNIKNFFDSATNHTLLYRYGAERGIHTFHFIAERGCDCETVRLPKDDTVSVRL